MLHMVTAIIKPQKLDDVKEALKGVGIQGMTITEVKGFGRQKGHTEVYRGVEYQIDFVPKVKLEILVATEEADKLIDVILGAAQTGKIGDGKVWAVEADRAVRIRTGERGPDAL